MKMLHNYTSQVNACEFKEFIFRALIRNIKKDELYYLQILNK